MMGGRSSEQWVAQYSSSHQHPVNRLCHSFGIPMIAVSLPLFAGAWYMQGWWWVPITLFLAGWALQFIGHAFEGKPPEFFSDPRFILVGMRWWMAKMRGKA